MHFSWFSLLFICMYVIDSYFLGTVEPVYYGHLGTSKKCPDYQGVLVVLYETEPFWTLTKCLDYAGVHIFKCPHYRFHCSLTVLALQLSLFSIKNVHYICDRSIAICAT